MQQAALDLSTVWLEMPAKRSGDTVPQRRDPVATRKKLLTAARLEFARHGFAGARVDEIAERAGVNKQLVYHYFGDKDALYLAVLEWVYADIREQERQLNLEGLPPEKAIRKLIEASFDYLATNPDFIVLLNDENRGGARHVRGSTRLEAMHSPLVKSVSHILHEGVRTGVFRKGIDPIQLYISIAGLSYFYLSNTPTLSAIFGKDLSSRAARRARRRHVADLVLHSLRP
ncbi:TetR/AcrR family transcriptional regulator [Bradyrhizobium japonicum]|jgi:TetR/AcrR family transcriptional regulator|uniref:TetR/AcrR family transcriptional regulator n=2 Tax=Nitrobacteraceae TaxID=41294 RepID=A0ABV2RZ51_BRAJP|nr:TetR/AcrR family transcriptional regulator [Bradyrhizobium japonicum]MCD9104811.1 TetR family transcriptional regulator [Bradyrhizobium japonicum]MCD9254709.1 TetR family transcriptional regulator [Bradyrhizobium japonicum SEMIA 5079]MCD9819520.1 TetR family transcriptional regulator [Bradyrhizobium japonicum]MCD9893405.1 TetR family transcriptional regulator [Bradyrhizobium japonicum]MCD9909157.1 TetR family transcriptional regulator [Bradyrhizobium japonicum]